VNARIDGIVVPTHRRADHLATALDLAARLRCPLVAVHSGDAEISQIIALAEVREVRCYAVAVERILAQEHLPGAVREVQPGSRRQRAVSAARNVGLLVARLTGWRRVLFLDDDMRDVDLERLARGGRRLIPGGLSAAGWVAQWYPDNSVVCHANRLAGNPQGTFIGAGALVVAVNESTPHFPVTYNEDWFFLFPLLVEQKVGHGGTVLQLDFDPYASVQRAADEEFGDLVGEGLFHLLHEVRDGALHRDALELAIQDGGYWATELDHRGALIDRVVARLAGGLAPHGTDEWTVTKALASLATARSRLDDISEPQIVSFLDAWRQDQATWRDALRRLHPLGSLPAALDQLKIDYETTTAVRTE
jgi:hypothetical protein